MSSHPFHRSVCFQEMFTHYRHLSNQPRLRYRTFPTIPLDPFLVSSSPPRKITMQLRISESQTWSFWKSKFLLFISHEISISLIFWEIRSSNPRCELSQGSGLLKQEHLSLRERGAYPGPPAHLQFVICLPSDLRERNTSVFPVFHPNFNVLLTSLSLLYNNVVLDK